jgi:hypothetical protein
MVATRHNATALVSDLLMSRADLETMARDYRDAVQSLETADVRLREALRVTPDDFALQRQRAELLVRMSRQLRLAELSGTGCLEEARLLAEQLGAGGLVARCEEENAERNEARGDRKSAARHWELAAEIARNAGDASLEAMYLERLRLLRRGDIFGTGNLNAH